MMRTQLILALMVALLVRPSFAHADPAKDFVLSCTYGVLAGSLVGTATLAFSGKPGDNLDHIARGASIGLYAGILLGLYVVNAGPPNEDETQAKIPKLQVYPITSQAHGIEGGAVSYSFLSF